jgi:hypothetical protein
LFHLPTPSSAVLGCRAGMPADGQASSGYLITIARAFGGPVHLAAPNREFDI